MHDPERHEQLTGSSVAEMLDTEFNGELWAAMVPLALPLQEMAFVAAVMPETVELTAGHPATGFGLMLIETKHGPVLRFNLTFVDNPASPLELRLPVNPVGAREWIEMLAGQQTFQILFFDARDGSALGRRVLKLEDEQRDVIRQTLGRTALEASDPERWRAAVRDAADYL
jgi:hypothetical protein